MGRLVVVSNRVAPIMEGKPATGGLAVAVHEALKKSGGGLWFGWSGSFSLDPDNSLKVVEKDRIKLATVDLRKKDHEDYYRGYSNSVLWPLCHYRTSLLEQKESYWKGYLRVNRFFVSKLKEMIEPDDEIWIHDYHLFPLADLLRQEGFRNKMGFFLHIPFPPPDIFTAATQHRELVRQLCAYNLVGFQTDNDHWNFCNYVTREAGGEVDGDTVHCFGRKLTVAAFPIGIYPDALQRDAAHVSNTAQLKRFIRSLNERKLVIGVDRLDYSKGLDKRFMAYEKLLNDHQEQRGEITYVQIAPPSREEVATYREIRATLESLAGSINGRYADVDWVPLRYLNKSFDRTQLMGFFRAAQACLVTPLRDGMNLVAKEYVAAQNPEDPGVLVLSRFAGAARELGECAVLVNPFDTGSVSDGLYRAIHMKLEERRERWSAGFKALERTNLGLWRERFLRMLTEAPEAAEQTVGTPREAR